MHHRFDGDHHDHDGTKISTMVRWYHHGHGDHYQNHGAWMIGTMVMAL